MESTKFDQKGKEDTLRNKVGEVVEKIGHKVSDAGAPKIGQKIHDLGDQMEESHSNPSHPHKTK